MQLSRKALRVAAGVSVGALALGLAGCGPNLKSGSSEDEGSVDWSTIEPAKEISYWSNHPGGSIDLEKQIIENFTAETGIKVNLVTAGANYGEVYQKFQTAQTGGEIGDLVVLSDVQWFSGYLAGSIMPVDDVLAAAGVDTADYQTTFYDDYLYEGAHYAVPFARSTPVFYYNKDHYAAAGLDDAAPETWDDVKAYSEALKTAVPDATPYGWPEEANYPGWVLANPVWGWGGEWSDKWDFSTASDDKTVEALQFAQDSMNDGWAKVVPSIDTAFAAGVLSQFIGSTGVLRGVVENAKFDVGVGFLPLGPTGDDKVVPTGGAGIAIASKVAPENQLAAAMFLGYMTNPESTAYFSEGTGYVPVQKDVDMSAVYADNPQFKVVVDQLDRTRTQAYARVLLPGGDIALAKGLNQILTANADVKSTMEGVEKEWQTLYDRDIKDTLDNK